MIKFRIELTIVITSLLIGIVVLNSWASVAGLLIVAASLCFVHRTEKRPDESLELFAKDVGEMKAKMESLSNAIAFSKL